MSQGSRSTLLAILLIVARVVAQAQDITWQSLGGPYGGDVHAVAASHTGIIFAGAWRNGVFRSTDDGVHWFEANSGITGRWIESMTVNKVTGHVFVGTMGEWGPGSIYKSADDGQSWVGTEIGFGGENGWVRDLECDSLGYLYAAAPAIVGVLRSTDDGESWQQKTNGFIDSNFPERIAVGRGTEVLALVFTRVYRSTDRGDTWVILWQSEDLNLYDIVVSKRGNIFVVSNAGVYCSTDGGQTWPLIRVGRATSAYASEDGSVYISTPEGLERTQNEGQNWTLLDLSGLHVNALTEKPSGVLIAGTMEQGVLKSTDAGSSWTSATQGIMASIRALAVSADGSVVAGTSSGTVARLAPGATVWNNDLQSDPLSALEPTAVSCVVANRSGMVFAGLSSDYSDGILYRSTDNGSSWSPSDSGMHHELVNAIAISYAPGAWEYLYAVTSFGTYLSTVLGERWEYVGYAGSRVAVDAAGYVYRVETNGYGPLWRSTDQGRSWTQITSLGTSCRITALATDPGGYLYAGTSGDIAFGEPSDGVYRSTDSGDSWVQTSSELGTYNVNAIYVTGGDTVLAGTTGGGVAITGDHGDTWTTVNAGLHDLNVYAFSGDTAGYIYAGTDWGVYRTSVPVTVVSVPPTAEQPGEFSLEQNYPNPFNPSTTIRFGLPSRSHVTLTVFNTLGQKVATLEEGEREAGFHEADFDASGLASGVYLYRLQARSFVETRRMVVLR